MLKGIRVLDFTRVLAGPYATRLLADFGAEVIKVQSETTADGAEANLQGYFNTWNRNKRSITLNMNHPEAVRIVTDLTAISDVVVENFSPRVMSNWGLDFKTLKKVKSDLIMLRISGMGQSGPYKNFVAFGSTVQSLGGPTYLTSYSQDEPVGPGFTHVDPLIGLYGVLAVLTALEHRDRTGQGQMIDLSAYETAATLIGPALMSESAGNEKIKPSGNQTDYMPAAPYGCYPCLGKDKWCVIGVFTDSQWHSLCNLIDDPRLSEKILFNPDRRKENEEEINDLIKEWTQRHAPDVITDRLQEAGIPAGSVQDARDLARDPHLGDRNVFIPLHHPLLGRTMTDRSPVRFQSESRKKWKYAPLLGEDNQYVYADLLGFNREKINTYMKKGIIV